MTAGLTLGAFENEHGERFDVVLRPGKGREVQLGILGSETDGEFLPLEVIALGAFAAIGTKGFFLTRQEAERLLWVLTNAPISGVTWS